MRTIQMRAVCLLAALTAGAFLSALVQAQEPGEIIEKEVEGVNAVVLQADVPTHEIGQTMPDMFGKLFGYLGSKGIQPSGAAFTVYYSYDPEGNTVFEVGAPVASNVQTDGDFEYKEFPGTMAVTMLYKGAYEDMGPAYDELMMYLEENELNATGQAWEIYLTNPEEVQEPDDNETLIYFPIEE